jgi:hypothetical protein
MTALTLTYLEDTAGLVESPLEGGRSCAPAPGDGKFSAVFVAGGGCGCGQVGVFDPGAEGLPDAVPDAVHNGGRHLEAANLVLVLDAPGLEYGGAAVYNVLDPSGQQGFPGDSIEPPQAQLLTKKAAGLKVPMDISGELLGLVPAGHSLIQGAWSGI